MDKYTLELDSDNKYFSKKTWEKLLDIFNKKELTKILNLQN